MGKIGFLQEMMRRFRRDQRGNVALLFGLTLVPMMGVVGVAVDYSRASNARQALSSAIDAAALMAARDAQKLSDADVKTRVAGWIRDNLPPDVKEGLVEPTITIDRTARTVQISAKVDMPTTIAKIIGTNHILVASNSRSTWGTNKIELALALDNTGSMDSSGKMTALKLASKNLLKIMKEATIETDQIRVSIVPFNTQVRLARSFKDEPWMRYGVTRDVTCDRGMKNCEYYNPIGRYTVGVNDTTNLVCTNNGRTCVDTMTTASWAKTGQGCVADRDKSYDTTDGGAYSASTQQYPAFWCLQPSLAEIMPLSSDWAALEARIDTMTPTGNTNVTIGAVWGWATLSPGAPFTEAKPSSEPRLRKYMILLTDGKNTENRFTGNVSDIDDRTKLACTNIKAAGISLYTIRVINGDEALLKGCASEPSMYYNVQNASELDPIFKSIANEISQVRLTL